MDTRRTSVALAVLLGAILAKSATGDVKRRIGEAGSWRNGQQWRPEGAPRAADTCFQEEEATGVMFYDDFTEDEQAASLTVLAGGSPPRGLLITDGSYFDIGSFSKSPDGPYEVTVGYNATFVASSPTGGISGGNWTLVGDVPLRGTVRNLGAEGIDLQDGTWTLGPGASIWNMNGPIVGDLDNSTIAMTGGHGYIQSDVSDGHIRVAFMTLCPGCVLGTRGILQPWRLAEATGGVLVGAVVVIGEAVEDLGTAVLLRNGGILSASGSLSGELGPVIVQRGKLMYSGAGNVVSCGSFQVNSAAGLVQAEPEIATAEVDLGFDTVFDVRTDAGHFAGWDASGMALFGGTDALNRTMEVTYGDFDGLFFVDVACVPYRSFKVRATTGGTVRLVDIYDNAFHGVGAPPEFPEALYVNGDVIVGAGSTLDLNGINLYYSGTLTLEPNVQIVGGDPVQVRALNYGDFDEDCDVDLDDYLTFQLHYTGSGGETDWPPADGDCDKDVDLVDYAKFQLNFTGSLPGCDAGEGGNAPSGGGGDERFTGSLEELADWSWYHLSERQRLRLADRLDTVVRTGQGGDQTEQIAALAAMLR